MTATLQDITYWLELAKRKNATHLIVACDRYDFDNYPVYVGSDDKVQDEIDRVKGQPLQDVDEVYNMSMDIKEQLSKHRVWNI